MRMSLKRNRTEPVVDEEAQALWDGFDERDPTVDYSNRQPCALCGCINFYGTDEDGEVVFECLRCTAIEADPEHPCREMWERATGQR